MSEPGDGGEVPVAAPDAGAGAHAVSAARPVVLPETFDGTKNWDEWFFHFENVAAVNGWDDADKLKWLRVRVTGRAQKALHLLPESSRRTYEATRTALQVRFDPESRRTLCQAELQIRRKKANEGWADFADDLKALADKGYPTLQEEAREQLAINAFLQQLTQPQIAFSVKQKRPKTLDDAVAATLEMESYLAGPSPVGIASALSYAENLPVCPVSALSQVDKLTQAVEQLTERVERLQRDTRPRPRRAFTGECWTCRQPGHMARNCPETRSTHQGKLATSSATDRSLEVNPRVQTVTPETIVYASPVMPMSGYRLLGSVDGVNISLLLDTGAAVTLLRADMWSQVATKTQQGLQPWSMARLVSAGGTPLTVHGCARVDLMFGPEKFVTEIVVVSPLTSEAILGLDFLMKQQASIDLTSKTLHLRERGCNIPLQDPTKPLETTDMFPVHAAMTVEVPPRSTLQVAGSIPNRLDLGGGGETAGVRLDSVCGGETAGVRLDSVCGGETAGVRLDSVCGGETAGVGMEKQELLWSIVENSGADLSSGSTSDLSRQVRMPVDLMYGNPNSHTATVPQYVASLRSSLHAAYDQVRNTMTTRLSRQKDLYDRRAHGEPFSSGDLVWLHTPAVPRGHSKKLHCPWTGPYRVVSRLSDAVYRIQHSQLRRKRLVVHFDRLKPCSPDTRLTTSARWSRAAPSLLPDAPVGTDLELLADDPNVGADVDQGQLHAAQDVPDPGGGVAMAPDTVAPSMQSGDMVTPVAVNNDHLEAREVPRYPRRTRLQPDRYCPVSKH